MLRPFLPMFMPRASAATAPVLTSLRDLVVDTAGGGREQVATGTGFTAASVIRVDGVAQTTTYVSATELRCTMPAHAAGSVAVTVANGAAVSNGIDVTYTSFTLYAWSELVLAPYSGSPWAGVASAGASSGRDFSGASAPSVGAAQGGVATADFDGLSNKLENSTLMSSLITTSAYSGFAIFYADSAVAAVSDSQPYSAAALYMDSGGSFGLAFDADGVRAWHWTPTHGPQWTKAACAIDGWHTAFVAFAGSTLKLYIDGELAASSAAEDHDAARMNRFVRLGCSYAELVHFDGRLLAAGISASALDAGTVAKFHALAMQKWDLT